MVVNFTIEKSVHKLLCRVAKKCFRAMPRQGHLDCVKRIHGYLSKMWHATIKIRTDAPDYSNIPVKLYDWECSCYADAKEEISLDAPEPKGKPVTMTSFFDVTSVGHVSCRLERSICLLIKISLLEEVSSVAPCYLLY